MLESLCNNFEGCQACNFIQKRLNIGVSQQNLRNFQEHLFEEQMRMAASVLWKELFKNTKKISWETFIVGACVSKNASNFA